MKSGKPKGKIPSLIGGTLGAPRKGVVKKQCFCKRCQVAILKGTECYEIPQLGGSFTNYRHYCDNCFRSIIGQTQDDLDVLLHSISG